MADLLRCGDGVDGRISEGPDEPQITGLPIHNQMSFEENANNEKLLREQADSAIAACEQIQQNANNEKLMREQADSAVADLQPMSFVENSNNEKLLRERADSAIAALKQIEQNANNEKLMREQADSAVADLQPMSNANNEKLLQERADSAIAALKQIQQNANNENLSNLLPNFTNKKDLTALLEKAVNKELASIAPTVVHSLSPIIEKISSLIQRDVVDKVVARLESSDYSKLQSTPMASQLRAPATSELGALSSDLALRPLVASDLRASTSNLRAPVASDLRAPTSDLHPRAPADFRTEVEKQVFLLKELNRLILDRNFEEAFSTALGTLDLAVVSWLCYRVGLQGILMLEPLPLSQNVLLSLLRMLSVDIQRDRARKLSWMRDVMSAIIIHRTKAAHMRFVFEHVDSCITSLSNSTSLSVPEMSTIRRMSCMIRWSVRRM